MTTLEVKRYSAPQMGFTLVELLVAISVVGLMTGVIISFILSYWKGTATLSNDSATFVERENAGDRLRNSLNVAAQLITQNSIADSNATVPDPSDATKTHWLLIHAIPGTKTTPAAGSFLPLFYYQAPSVDSSKNFILNGSQRFFDEYILYLNGTNRQLLLRTLANPNAAGSIAKTSCPPAIATTACPADLAISGDISSVDVNYYSKSGNVIDYTSIKDINGNYIGPDFTSVEVVQLTLHFYRQSTLAGGLDSINQTVVRVALRN